jgi:hypothetical protein
VPKAHFRDLVEQRMTPKKDAKTGDSRTLLSTEGQLYILREVVEVWYFLASVLKAFVEKNVDLEIFFPSFDDASSNL